MKKILFISYDGMTDPLGQSQVIPYLAGLTRLGYQFTILSCEKPEAFKKNKVFVDKLVSASGIDWVGIPYHKSPAVLSSVYDYFQLKKTAARLHKKNNYALVHTRPGVPTLVAMYLKKKYGIKFLNDIRGFWADERVDGGMWNLKNPIFKSVYNFFKKHERACVEKADAITCLTDAAKKEIASWDFSGSKEINVIPCSVDMELFDPVTISSGQKELLSKKLNIHKDDIVFTYLGSIGGWYLTREMMRFFKVLSEKIPHVKFIFISPHRHDIIIAAALQEGLGADKIITQHATRNEVPLLLSLSTYSVFFIKPCYSKISSSPTKHGEIMAMGIPVITNGGVGDVEAIVNNTQSGFVLKDFSEAEFQQAADKITASGMAFDHEHIRKSAQQYYDLENAIKQYSEVYARALK